MPDIKKAFKPRFPIWFKFVLLIVLITLLGNGVRSFTLITLSRDSLRQEALNSNFYQAHLAADFASTYINTIQAHMRVFASQADIRQAVFDNTLAQLQPALFQFVQIQTALDSSGIYDSNGIQGAISTVNATTVGQSFADRDWFQQALATHQPYLGAPIMSRVTGNPVIPYSIPILDEQGQMRGVLAGAISISKLSDAIVNIGYTVDTRASITDLRNGGVIIAHTDPARVMTPVTGKNAAVSRLLAGESGVMETASSSGEMNLVGFVPVPGLPWGIMVLTPSAMALASVDNLVRNAILTTSVIIITAIVIGILLTLGITRPLRRLVEGTKQIGSGNLDYKVASSANDELGDLSRAIAGMAQNLKQTLVSRDKLATEVIEREKAEAALASEIDRRRLVFSHLPVGIMILDPLTLHFKEFNKMAHEQLGYTFDEFSKLTIHDIEAIESTEETRAHVAAVLRYGQVAFETLQRHKSGELRNIYVIAQTLDTAGQIEYQCIWQDITERKLAEEALCQSKELLSLFIKRSPIYAFIKEVTPNESRVLMASENYEDMIGIPGSKMVGRTMQELFPAEFAANITAADWAVASFGKVIELDEELNGRQYSTIKFPIIMGGKNLLAGYTIDITERKQAEEENQRMREKTEMSSRLAAVGEMAAGIAHEINNPLTGVIGFSDLLLERPDLPEDVRDQLKVIADGGNRVKDIVRRMLTFARQHKPVKNSLNIHQLIDNTLEIRSYVLRTANIEVVKYYDPHLPWVVVDPGQIQQVFLNLIVNAEYSMKKAHGKGILTITTEKMDGHIRVSFKDDGMGMDKATREKLFHPFFSTKQVNEGTGLGLSLSRGIILEHGGTIEVESEIGKGATFIITLPLAQPVEEIQAEAAEVKTAASPGVKPARILVVDDEEGIRSLVTAVLSHSGHRVDATGDATVALVRLNSAAYDLVLLDIRMPGMSGMELYESIVKAHPELVGKFLFITGDTSDAQTRSFLEQNNLPYVTKPFDRETLLGKVNAQLNLDSGAANVN